MNAAPQDSELTNGLGRVLFTEAAIRHRVTELGGQISRDYRSLNPVVIGVLKGVVFFMSDLLRAIAVPVRVDYMAISRYAPHAATKGAVRLTKDLEETVEDQHILFVEDVIDTGLTLSYLLRVLRARRPASLHVCTLFDKPQRRLAEIPLRYIGFTLPDRFVVGYGLDFREGYRHLPYVAELKAEALKQV